MPIDVNRKGGTVFIRDTANATYTLANLEHADDDTVVGAAIAQVTVSADAAVTIKRGANTVMKFPSGWSDFDLRRYRGLATADEAASIVIETASANCTVVLEVVKRF